MHIFSAFIFSLSANIDNFTVAMSYGINKIKIGLLSNLLIALISSLGTLISMSLGLIIIKIISASVANLFGCVILILIGISFIIDFFKKRFKIQSLNFETKNDFSIYKAILDYPEIVDINKSGTLEVKESFTLALALTLNNFGLGIGVSITGINIFLTTSLTFIFSLLSIFIGYFIGKKYLSKLFGNYATLFSGILIIMLGIYEIFV
jgi:putative sporulation protein YtaF